MKLFDVFTTASSNMFRSKLRTSLTILAIFIGAFTLTLTSGLGSGISRYLDKQVASLGAKDVLVIMATNDAGNPISTDAPKKYDPNKRTTSIAGEGNRTVVVLADKDLAKIRTYAGIKSVEAYQPASIDYAVGKSADKFVASIDNFLSGENFPLDAGRYPDNGAAKPEVLIPASYLESLGYADAKAAVGQTIKLGITNGLSQQTEIAALVSGVQQKNLVGGNSLYVNNNLMAALRQTQNVGLPASATSTYQAAIARYDTSLSDAQLKDLKDKLKKAGYQAQTVEDQIGSLKSVINGIVMVLDGFAAIALLAASFGIINTLLMSVQERTKEIGLMKAMGMGARRIFLLFSIEAMMLGFWGSLIGSLAAIGVGSAINSFVLTSFLKDLVGLQLLVFTPLATVIIVAIVMTIAFLAGTLPAIRASRQNPITSLRYE